MADQAPQKDTKRIQEKFIETYMDQWWTGSNSIRVFITGKTGAGKSSLVNAIFDKTEAKVGETLRPETSKVCKYDIKMNGIKLSVWDSPGLQDGINDEEAYLNDIEKECKDKTDLFLYCIDMTEDRLVSGGHDIEAMCKLTKKLGIKIWDNAVIILTFANRYIIKLKQQCSNPAESELKTAFEEGLEMWKRQIAQELRKNLSLEDEVLKHIPIVPSGKRGRPTFFEGYRPWLIDLWIESLLAMKKDAQPALLKMSVDRLKRKCDIKSEEAFQELLKKEYIIISDMAKELGSKLNANEAGLTVGEKCGARVTKTHSIKRKICLIEGVLDVEVFFPEGSDKPCVLGLTYAGINY